jgi:hypothetical protein
MVLGLDIRRLRDTLQCNLLGCNFVSADHYSNGGLMAVAVEAAEMVFQVVFQMALYVDRRKYCSVY